MKKALYPGSFDPMTLGHLDLVRRGLDLFDRVIVAVGENPAKKALFSVDERVAMIRDETAKLDRVDVTSFSGLAVQCAHEHDCTVLLRGLRTVSDFESEYAMALTNRTLADNIETVFCMPNEKYFYVSSRLIKEVFAMGGDASQFLSPAVTDAVRRQLGVVKP